VDCKWSQISSHILFGCWRTHHPVEDIETKEVYSNVQGLRLSQNKCSPKAKWGWVERGALILAMPYSNGVIMLKTWAEFKKKTSHEWKKRQDISIFQKNSSTIWGGQVLTDIMPLRYMRKICQCSACRVRPKVKGIARRRDHVRW